MNAIVIEHVKIGDLPEEWRTRLSADAEMRVTVRIEEEVAPMPATIAAERADDPLFGMWSDRPEVADVENYVREIRAPRFSRGA